MIKLQFFYSNIKLPANLSTDFDTKVLRHLFCLFKSSGSWTCISQDRLGYGAAINTSLPNVSGLKTKV